MTPSLTGRGWGWVGCLAAEAVSQFPGPPLEDPPTSPPRNSTGAQLGGAGWDDWRTGCPLPTGGAASRPQCQLAWHSGCSAAARTITSSGGSAADVPPSAATGAAVEPLIAGCAAAEPLIAGCATAKPLRALLCTRAFSGPAPGWAGDRGGDLAGTAPSEAQRSDLQAGPFAKRASRTRSVKETGPAVPGYGKGPPHVSAGIAGLTVLREGWLPDRGETLGLGQRLDTQRNRPASRSGDTPRPTETWRHHLHQRRHNAQRHTFRRQIVHAQRRPCSPFRELRVFRVNLINSTA